MCNPFLQYSLLTLATRYALQSSLFVCMVSIRHSHVLDCIGQNYTGNIKKVISSHYRTCLNLYLLIIYNCIHSSFFHLLELAVMINLYKYELPSLHINYFSHSPQLPTYALCPCALCRLPLCHMFYPLFVTSFMMGLYGFIRKSITYSIIMIG